MSQEPFVRLIAIQAVWAREIFKPRPLRSKDQARRHEVGQGLPCIKTVLVRKTSNHEGHAGTQDWQGPPETDPAEPLLIPRRPGILPQSYPHFS